MELSYMNFSSVCISAFVFLVCLSFSTSAIKSNETDLQALLEFKTKITHDPFEVLSSWNDSIHFCRWQGVTCGRQHQRVISLDLHSLKLAGSISPAIGNLSFLRILNLQNNSFGSEIPHQIGYLSRLRQLKLLNNSIGGKIPINISSCSNLIAIRLSNNKLEGHLPVELGALSNLQFLSINQNNLTGSIPRSLGNLSHLQRLSLDFNGLVGTIPDSLGQLRNLTFFNLRSNKLSGTIPSSIFNLSSITALDIGENHFHGNLPSDLGFSLPNLQFFAISSNEFTGRIPASLSNASNLELLSLLRNKLTGEVPSLAKLHRLRDFSITVNHLGSGEANDLNFLHSLTNATALEELGINGNNFGGMIPEVIGNLSTILRILLLDNNQITGSIPSAIGSLASLQDLEVWNNQLSGSIPDSIGKLQNLVLFALNNNMLSGDIPSSLGNLTNLIQLLLEENNLSGSIPSTIGGCKNLLGLDLSQNNLSGSIAPQVLSLSSLSIYLDLSQNSFTGTLAIEIGNLKNLGELDINGNKLSGEIPSTLGSCVSLEILNMDGNNFKGLVPSSLSSLKALQILDLSSNNLSGKIPEFLSHFSALLYLNLSYNNFEGMVPSQGVFENASATSVEGNDMLCGGIPKFQLPKCISVRHGKSGLARKVKLVIAIMSVLTGVTLVLFILFLFLFGRQKKRNDEPSSNFLEKKILDLSYQTLYNATHGFSSANLIGMGSFGSVYKGTVDREGTSSLVAIKVFNLMHRGAFTSFLAECETLRSIRHRNLVKVLTACSSIDHHGNDFKALVYEFMVNGSLEDWLHWPVDAYEADMASRNLNILQRLNIAIDVACALDYLHHHCETQIVHCDLKPSNILLDNELTGHVGDFGLARFLVEVTHDQSSSIGVRGTVGYAPPEYGIGGEVSTSGDVYSYGILLLEMFTGKRPTDDMFNQGFNLHKFVNAALQDEVEEILDPILVSEIQGDTSTDSVHNEKRSKTSSNRPVECLISVLQVGVNCSAASPSERMSIADVARQLISTRDKLVGAGIRSERRTSIAIQLAGKSSD